MSIVAREVLAQYLHEDMNSVVNELEHRLCASTYFIALPLTVRLYSGDMMKLN